MKVFFKTKNNSGKIKIILIILLPALFYIAVRSLVEYSPTSICLFKLLTRHDCWGCGITRAFNELFQLNFIKASDYNPRIILIAPLMLWVWITTLKNTIKVK